MYNLNETEPITLPQVQTLMIKINKLSLEHKFTLLNTIKPNLQLKATDDRKINFVYKNIYNFRVQTGHNQAFRITNINLTPKVFNQLQDFLKN